MTLRPRFAQSTKFFDTGTIGSGETERGGGQFPALAPSLVSPSHHNGSFLAFDDCAPPADLATRLEHKCELIRDRLE